MTTESEIIEDARQFNEQDINTLLDALESFYMNGSADEQDGDADTFGHFYRVDRWIVWTDSQGFHDVSTYATEEIAHHEFEQASIAYAETFNVDECF